MKQADGELLTTCQSFLKEVSLPPAVVLAEPVLFLSTQYLIFSGPDGFAGYETVRYRNSF